MRKKSSLVCGWGINDADYPVHKTEVVNGKRKITWVCPYYVKWHSIIVRCFDPKYLSRQPTYVGCTIDPEWKYLSNFIKWVDSQPNRDWMNCVPDKDFLSEGNKHYGQDTVVFISKQLNAFILDSGKTRGLYMIGVSPSGGKKNPYLSSINSPFSDRNYIGIFPTELEAHLAWQAKKHEYACQLADLQDDPRVAKALRERYAPDKDWSSR